MRADPAATIVSSFIKRSDALDSSSAGFDAAAFASPSLPARGSRLASADFRGSDALNGSFVPMLLKYSSLFLLLFWSGSSSAAPLARVVIRADGQVPGLQLLSADAARAAKLAGRWGVVTSLTRTRERNRAVGGAENSFHLVGRAIDVARRRGVRHEQIDSELRRAGLTLLESLDEGDHSHFAFGTSIAEILGRSKATRESAGRRPAQQPSPSPACSTQLGAFERPPGQEPTAAELSCRTVLALGAARNAAVIPSQAQEFGQAQLHTRCVVAGPKAGPLGATSVRVQAVSETRSRLC